jgi:hypothetical protein
MPPFQERSSSNCYQGNCGKELLALSIYVDAPQSVDEARDHSLINRWSTMGEPTVGQQHGPLSSITRAVFG